MHLLLVHSLLFSFGLQVAQAAVTAYGPHVQSPLVTTTAASASYTGAASYDQTILTAPPPPNPPPPTQFNVELQTGGDLSGLSIQQEGSFFGFSIEFSVTTQVREYFLHPHLYPLNISCSRAEQVTNPLTNKDYDIYPDRQFFPSSTISQPYGKLATTRGQR
jgi:hypothetical protein